ncbi:MAG: hypothetical protein R2827_06535 [Bdellovibrionales bacterium]
MLTYIKVNAISIVMLMEVLMNVGMLLIGFAILILGGEALVRSAISMAVR